MNALNRWKHIRLFSFTLLSLFLLGMLAGDNIPADRFSAAFDLPFGDTEVGLNDMSEGNEDIIDPVTGKTTGHRNIANALDAVVELIKILVGVIAILMIVWSGTLMVTAGGEEEKQEEGKRGVTWGILGLIFMLLIDSTLIDVFYGGGEFAPGTTLENEATVTSSISEGTTILLAAIQWFEGILIVLAVVYLIFSGLQMIMAMGEEESISKQKSVFTWFGVGIIVLLINKVIIQKVLYPAVLGENYRVNYSPDADQGIVEIVGIVRYFLVFLALVAFVAFLYGGAMMILSLGDDERVETGKKTVAGAIIGLVVILISFVLVSAFITGDLSTG